MKATFLLLLTTAVSIESVATPLGPVETLKATIQELKDSFKTRKPSEKEIRKIIEPIFDIGETARRSLGAAWIDATPAEQKEFIELFANVLLSSYVGKLKKINEVEIKFEREETTDDGKATVYTSIISRGESYPFIYRMHLVGESWKVYDLSIENISLITNYRNEFGGIVRKRGMKGLLDLLRNKVYSSED